MRVLENTAIQFVFSPRLHKSGTDLKLKLQRKGLNIALRFKHFTASKSPEGQISWTFIHAFLSDVPIVAEWRTTLVGRHQNKSLITRGG
jgi:hypothetical protein